MSNRKTSRSKRWSGRVTETSDAMDLKHGLFSQREPAKIASSLLDSARRSRRRKSPPLRSAMSMLNFYINRAGTRLTKKQRAVLDAAKEELQKLKPKKTEKPKSNLIN